MSLVRQLLRHWTFQVFAPGALLRSKYNAFRELLEHDEACLLLISELEDIHFGNVPVDWTRVVLLANQLAARARQLVGSLSQMDPGRYMGLGDYLEKIIFYVRMGVELAAPDVAPPHVVDFNPDHEKSRDASEPDPHLLGGKAANLARVARETSLRVPGGFVVTSNAFHYFLEYNGLREEIEDRLARVSLTDPEGLGALCNEIQALVLEADMPPSLAADMAEASARFGDTLFAVRSSAVHEDGEASFAGQYSSRLFVTPDRLATAYRQVVAGKYTPKAVTYRILYGLADVETPLAALVLPMVDARAAGVVYTRDARLAGADGPALGVYAVPDLGEPLVSGQTAPQTYRLPRPDSGVPGGATIERTDTGRADALLERPQLLTLAGAGLELEGLFGEPQDVEWALDAQGAVHILQSRPMRVEREAIQGEPASESAPPSDLPAPLLSGCERAATGVGSGEVLHVDTVLDAAVIPPDAVIVVRTLSPSLVRVVQHARAVVSATGSRASHFASVAREFGLPVLVSARDPFQALPHGSEVTVDGYAGAIYPGEVPSLLERGETDRHKRSARRTPLQERLDKVMPHIARLTLVSPDPEDFRPEKWRSLHDVVRWVHETGVGAMFSLVGKAGRGMARSRRLVSRLPILMYVLDLGGGLFDTARDQDIVRPEDIRCEPMWALWWGLAAEDVEWPEHLPVLDWEELDRVSAGIFSDKSRLLASYAVLGGDYMHLMLRFGYHFAVVDALCAGADPTSYVRFRFKGCGGGGEGCFLRLSFISGVLTRLGFEVHVQGDMLDAVLSHAPAPLIQRRLAVLGYLLARSRLLDVRLKSEADVAALETEFMERVERLRQGGEAKAQMVREEW